MLMSYFYLLAQYVSILSQTVILIISSGVSCIYLIYTS